MKIDKDWIICAGGGDSSEQVRTRDTLLSQDNFELVLGVSQGPIKGLVQSSPGTMENFFAGDTPAYNLASGEGNFSDFTASIYSGLETDPEITLQLGGQAANQSVNVALGYMIPIVRTTTSVKRGQFDRIEVRLDFGQLLLSNNDGVFEATAHLKIEYKPSNSGTWLLFDNLSVIEITGKSTNGYTRDFLIDVTPQPATDYDVRVTKLDEDTVQGVDDLSIVISWESMQLVKKGTLKFDSLAFAHIYGKASNQFTSIPEFSGIYDGMLIRVPSNYNPELRTYDETVPWDGMLKAAYSNNPVWVLFALITNTTYGLAHYFKGVSADRYEFYEESKWVDQMVPDGRGGFQPRFTFNEWLVEPQPGIEFLRYVAGSFNAILTDNGDGLISVRTDRVRPAKMVFTPENVDTSGFSYTFTDIATRYNEITAVFVNPETGWEEDRRSASYDNTDLIAANGRIPYEFVAVGCTDPQEATRRANQRYISANEEVTMVSFITTRMALFAGLLDTIQVADPDADWGAPGRIKSVVGNTIHLRDPIYFATLIPRTIKIQTTDGLVPLTITPAAIGETYTLEITTGTYPTATAPDRTVFVVEDTSDVGLSKPFRILSLEEVEGKPDVIRVSAIEVAEDKYPSSDTGTTFVATQYSYRVPGSPVLPTSMLVQAATPLIGADGTIQSRVEVLFKRPTFANTDHFEIDFKISTDSTWMTVISYGDGAYLSPIQDGATYRIRLFAVSPVGIRSERALEQLYVANPPALPIGPVEDFDGTVTTGGITWGWKSSEDPIYKDTEVRAVDSGWGSPVIPPLFRGRADYFYEPVLTSGTRTRFAKHRNVYGVYSAVAATDVVNVTTEDLSASGNDGISYVPPSWAPGMIGGSADLNFFLNRIGPTTPDTGEISITGTKLFHPNGTQITAGITGYLATPFGEGMSGRFYIVYSSAPIATRFPGLSTGTVANMVLVRETNLGGWEAIDNNGATAAFTPLPDDCILASCEAVSPSSGITSIFSFLSGVAGSAGRSLRLLASSQLFRIDKAGTVGPVAITFTAAGIGLTGGPVFSVIDGTATLNLNPTFATLLFTNLTTDTATVKVAWDGLEDYVTVAKVEEGLDSILVMLSNPTHTIATAADGTGGNYATAGGSFEVYRGDLEISTGFGVAYSIISPAPGLTMSLNPATGAYSVSDLTPNQATAILRANVDGVDYDRPFTITKSRQGTPGSTGTAYWLMRSVASINKNASNVFTPPSLTFTILQAVGTASPAPYPGRFAIATTIDGTTFVDQYVSAADESSKVFGTPALAALKAIRVRTYLAGGTVTLLDEETIPVVLDGSTGAAGLAALTPMLSNSAHSVPATEAGNVTSYVGSGTLITVLDGTTPMTFHTTPAVGRFRVNSVTVNPPGAINPGSISGVGSTVAFVNTHDTLLGGQDVAVITYELAIQRASGTVFLSLSQTITKSKAGAPGSPGAPGAPGSSGTRGSVRRFVSGAVWSNAVASAAVPGGAPILGDEVTIYDGDTFAETRIYTGATWALPGTIYDGSLLVKGSVTANAVNTNLLFADSVLTRNFNVRDSAGNIFISSANGALAVGSNPMPSGTTMTGAGARFASNGTAVIGNAAANITFNGSTLYLNGNIVAAKNLNANSATLVGSASAAYNHQVGYGFSISNEDIPQGQSTVPVTIIGSQDVLGSTQFHMGVGYGGWPNTSGFGDLLASQPPFAGVYAMATVVNLGPGWYVAACWDPGAADGNTRLRTVTVIVGKR